ncbi:hypothetical protein Dda_1520 [Drechslerella dactyloides]|uniref:Uncharacterized protein n=1 Tax=Drechslerella dactyloides TaxID=74499 RepID=A0AAD6J6B3_DREDA|nr:hypothetical protein Dda_1520 [Drechslerella dactyloides]
MSANLINFQSLTAAITLITSFRPCPLPTPSLPPPPAHPTVTTLSYARTLEDALFEYPQPLDTWDDDDPDFPLSCQVCGGEFFILMTAAEGCPDSASTQEDQEGVNMVARCADVECGVHFHWEDSRERSALARSLHDLVINA